MGILDSHTRRPGFALYSVLISLNRVLTALLIKQEKEVKIKVKLVKGALWSKLLTPVQRGPEFDFLLGAYILEQGVKIFLDCFVD